MTKMLTSVICVLLLAIGACSASSQDGDSSQESDSDAQLLSLLQQDRNSPSNNDAASPNAVQLSGFPDSIFDPSQDQKANHKRKSAKSEHSKKEKRREREEQREEDASNSSQSPENVSMPNAFPLDGMPDLNSILRLMREGGHGGDDDSSAPATSAPANSDEKPRQESAPHPFILRIMIFRMTKSSDEDLNSTTVAPPVTTLPKPEPATPIDLPTASVPINQTNPPGTNNGDQDQPPTVAATPVIQNPTPSVPSAPAPVNPIPSDPSASVPVNPVVNPQPQTSGPSSSSPSPQPGAPSQQPTDGSPGPSSSSPSPQPTDGSPATTSNAPANSQQQPSTNQQAPPSTPQAPAAPAPVPEPVPAQAATDAGAQPAPDDVMDDNTVAE